MSFSNEILVEANGLVKAFKDNVAVNNISLSVKAGKIFGIVGPDGAGKSTLLRMLTGILRADKGTVKIAGYDSVTQLANLKEQIAYMSQKYGLYPDLTVEENIRFYADLYGVKQKGLSERIDELLHFSYMHPFKKRQSARLSGGMKQKLQLVCALIHTPRVLILDEPTNGVDPVSRRDFWRMLQGLLEQGVSIVVSTSYLDEAERCHEIALMYGGNFMQVGTPDEIKKNSGGKILKWRSPSARRVFAGLDLDKAADMSIFGDTIKIYGSDNVDEEVNQLNKVAKERNCQGEWIEAVSPTLEDVFVKLVRTKHKTSKAKSVVFNNKPAIAKEKFSADLSNLTKTFGDFTAVDHFSLQVKPGEILGFLGPNGAGKSTTIRMLCGLLIPTSGEGKVAGFDLATESESLKKHIGYMSQKFSLYDDLSVLENIRFYGGIYGLDGEKLKEKEAWALELSNLVNERDIKTGILGLGFKQRLALVCALLHEPLMVFLDEPTSGVDPLTRRQFWNMIYDLSGMGVTVFVTTHYMEEAEFCDRVAFINRGKLMAVDSPENLKKHTIADKIICIKDFNNKDALQSLVDNKQTKDAYFFGADIHLIIPHLVNTEAFFKQTLPQYVENLKYHEIKPEMEDVFVNLSASHFIDKTGKEYSQ